MVLLATLYDKVKLKLLWFADLNQCSLTQEVCSKKKGQRNIQKKSMNLKEVLFLKKKSKNYKIIVISLELSLKINPVKQLVINSEKGLIAVFPNKIFTLNICIKMYIKPDLHV